jgi:4-hydroxy-tetrahydrodipicolinate synthase
VLRPGVHGILVTPFNDDESLDEASLRTLIDYFVAAGVAGVVVLGVFGEGDRLSDAERERVLAISLDHGLGRVDVTATATHAATVVTTARAGEAARAGVSAVMVSPPTGSSAGPRLRDHFRRIADDVEVPVVIQDYPLGSGVQMPVDFLAELVEVLPPGSAVKVEEAPTPPKIVNLRAAVPTLRIFGGLGGVTLLHDLQAGADGTMTGFAVPELLVEIIEAHRAGDSTHARRTYEQALPLLVFEAQPAISLPVRKEILRRRGAIAGGTVRMPASVLDPWTLMALDELLATGVV